jgi:hypothetical protein
MHDSKTQFAEATEFTRENGMAVKSRYGREKFF